MYLEYTDIKFTLKEKTNSKCRPLKMDARNTAHFPFWEGPFSRYFQRLLLLVSGRVGFQKGREVPARWAGTGEPLGFLRDV